MIYMHAIPGMLKAGQQSTSYRQVDRYTHMLAIHS